ncbi:hypothetical protein A3E46_01405 [Candidatus Woesebacteria bacterium RIFCSPHIGHO2_12_FULL_46_16]|uniref:Uncharacterized protein n=1 Tax=Candidatus Woesebacteria bacterium RIFCSPHIGHO2_12_FULL_46_16 TaxID=1802513 RepID=A0A1F8AWJ0_9BACT|nr:MAG: hypothetical protein A3E46_01405 [Candidatus Woesebacteria bacterium RIFCSPHIGHO2_12_FULL_46_16]
MTEKTERRPIEEQVSTFENWIGKLTETGIVEEINPQLVREVFEDLGANFEISEEDRKSLERFENLLRRPGMDAVWGKDRVREYRIWLRHYLKDYETRTGKPLPVLEGTTSKTSGGLKFFTDLTVFASGLMSFEKYQEITERRAAKGRLWQARKADEPIIPSKYSSFPPEFPQVAWGKIKSWRR